MWVFDTATLRFLTVNDAAVAHYGYSREEFLGMTIADIRPPQDAEVLRRHLRELDGDLGTPAIWLHRRRDGSMVHVEVTSHALTYDGRPARMVLAHDVTERLLAQQALQTLNETLERRVDERTRELAVANEELESFSYSVSHDLRAPLQVIDGFSRALASRHAERLDGQARHYLERIRENTRQMGQLIDDLLALARVTRAELVTEDFDLSVLAQRTVEKLRQRFPDREVDLVVKQPMPCTGDQRLLAIVMDNLVGNAWKFTSRVAHARIEVGCRAGEDGIPMYFVADNGAGFDMAYADKLFKAFQRLHGMAEFEGTGIGLATVHRIVTRHGGRVWAASEPGHGATFGFTLTGGVKPIP
jgi:PAS domain S-box-containing protein